MVTPSQNYTIIHLQAGSVDWAGVLTQFVLYIQAREGRGYATWAGDRLLRATRKSDGMVAFAEGKLLGFILFEIDDQTAELTFPWTEFDQPLLAADLAQTVLQAVQTEYPAIRYIRVERQLLSGSLDTAGLEQAGFLCYWRHRMALDLISWRQEIEVPEGYRLNHWHIRYLDAAAEVVYRANLGTLDAVLYAPFFGDSPAQCRKGLLAILAGRYGPIHPQATMVTFQGQELVGLNLVIKETVDLASVVEISVDPAHQGHQLGRTLMVRSLRVLKNENFERVELAVTKENTRALCLYRSMGFTEVDQFPVCVWPR